MKKVLFAISIAALALASCTEFEAETPVNFETADVPVISAEVAADDSVTIKVFPGANTGYYAYAFVEGEVDPASVNGSTLLSGKLAGAIATEVLNSAKKDSVVLGINKLTSNTKYTLVAIASSKETQALSQVVAQTVKTTDETIPEVVLKKYDYEVEDTVLVFYVPFDDPIALTDTASFYIQTYGDNYNYGAAGYYELKPIAQIDIPADSLSVAADSCTVIVKVPADAYAPNAYVALFIEAGSVVNKVGAVNDVFEDNLLIKSGTDYASLTDGLLAQYDAAKFELECSVEEDSLVTFNDPTVFAIELAPKCAGYMNGVATYGEGEIFVTTENVAGRKVGYTLKSWEIYSGSVFVGLDECDYGYYASFEIEEGIIEDVYGNVNKALELEGIAFCSYGYTLADVIGTYDVDCYDGLTGAPVSTTMSVAASDDEEAGNVMITGLMGIEAIYGEFDTDLGTIYLEPQKVKVGENTLDFDFYQDDDATILVPAAGELVNEDRLFVIWNGNTPVGALTYIHATRQ